MATNNQRLHLNLILLYKISENDKENIQLELLRGKYLFHSNRLLFFLYGLNEI